MEHNIYFDNNATTECDTEIVEAMLPFLRERYGNPSSIYSFGRESKDAMTEARNNIAELLNANQNEIIFTSCASESNVTAIMSAVKNNPDKKHIITTKVEHASIMETMKYLETLGYEITYLSVNTKGQIDLSELENAIKKDTMLIAVMMANNEIGNIYPIKKIGKIAKEHNILFHCDAVQAVGKVKIDVKELNVDTLSLSGHKIHTPKGIGALYVKEGIPYTPLIFGHQEKNRRGGTENVPYIVGLGKAAKLIIEDNYESNKKIENLRNKLEKEIKDNIEDVIIYGDIDNRLPNTSSIAFKGVKAEELLLMLEAFNINYSPIRISLSKNNTEEEVETFVKRIINIVSQIRKRG